MLPLRSYVMTKASVKIEGPNYPRSLFFRKSKLEPALRCFVCKSEDARESRRAPRQPSDPERICKYTLMGLTSHLKEFVWYTYLGGNLKWIEWVLWPTHANVQSFYARDVRGKLKFSAAGRCLKYLRSMGIVSNVFLITVVLCRSHVSHHKRCQIRANT